MNDQPADAEALPGRVFQELHPPLNAPQALLESERCLQCGGPNAPAPCAAACPAEIDVPRFIRQIRAGDPLAAARTIFSENVLGGSCARVCPVEALCQGACVLHEEGRRAVEIGRLQRFATDTALRENRPGSALPAKPVGKPVAVVGAGPAGLSAAAELARLGYAVTVFEARPLPGGLVTYGIAPYKQGYEPLPQEVDSLRALGVDFRFEAALGIAVPFEALDAYEAVFLGVGLGGDVQVELPGSELDGVWDSLDFIERVKGHRLTELDLALGRRVAVIGGGNTAIDVAREAVRLGAEATVLYRRTREQMPAYAHETAAAEREGVSFRWLVQPRRFLGTGRVRAVECLQMELSSPDASGRPRPVPVEGSDFVVEADTVIRALGQRPRAWLFERLGVALEGGRVRVDAELRTSRPGVYAGGDCVNGGATAVEAVRDGKRAARALHRRLSGQRATPPEHASVPVRTETEDGVYHHRQGAFDLATRPAYCKGCELCVESCPAGILALDERGRIVVTEPAACVFCGLCEARCPDFAIWVVKEQESGVPA